MKNLKLKRIYEEVSEDDGYRILVDRLWPRGISKEKAHLDEWLKELGPSNELRKWFGHIPERFEAFKTQYLEELKTQEPELKRIKKLTKTQVVSLCYGAKDALHNQAVVIESALENL